MFQCVWLSAAFIIVRGMPTVCACYVTGACYVRALRACMRARACARVHACVCVVCNAHTADVCGHVHRHVTGMCTGMCIGMHRLPRDVIQKGIKKLQRANWYV